MATMKFGKMHTMRRNSKDSETLGSIFSIDGSHIRPIGKSK
jgi:hypothetical protein